MINGRLVGGSLLRVHELILRVIVEVLVLKRKLHVVSVVPLMEDWLVLKTGVLVSELTLDGKVQVVAGEMLNRVLVVALIHFHTLF